MTVDATFEETGQSGTCLPRLLETLDTTTSSILHYLAPAATRTRQGGSLTVAMLYMGAIAATYFPLLLVAALGPLPLSVPTDEHPLPFLYDWNVAFMFIISFPGLCVLTVTDQPVLIHALKRAQNDGTVTIPQDDQTQLTERWSWRFRLTNLAAQILGVLVGAIVAYVNFITYLSPSVGFWIADRGQLLPVGYVFLYCIFLFYVLVTVAVLRSVVIALFLWDIVSYAQIHLLPFHPDKSGGLRPVGRLGLRNQYVLTLLGLNIVILVVVSRHYLTIPDSLTGLIMAAVLAYVILGPLVFMGPLLPFRSGMLRNKVDLMSDVAARIRLELDRLRGQLASGVISKDDEELVARLRKVGEVIDELPVWPFDASTLRKFITAYVIPMAGSAAIPVGKVLLGLLKT